MALGEEAKNLLFAKVTELRRAGVATDLAFGVKGIKNAMKSADRSGARFALIAGDRDLAEGVVQLKDLTTGEQTAVALEALVTTLKEKQL